MVSTVLATLPALELLLESEESVLAEDSARPCTFHVFLTMRSAGTEGTRGAIVELGDSSLALIGARGSKEISHSVSTQ